MGLQYPKSNCGTVDSKRDHAVDEAEDLPKHLFSELSWHWKLCHVLNQLMCTFSPYAGH